MNNKHNLALAEQYDQKPLPETNMPVTGESSHWHAFLTLGFCQTARGTVLKTCDHKGPLYVQKPFYPEGRDTAHVYLLHPPGGLVSGDRLTITANLAENTHVLITTPGAGRVYRARKDKTLQHQITQLNVAENSLMEWLPQETILYPNAHTRLENCIDLADNANAPQELPPEGVNLKELLADMEVNMINQALEAQGGIVARAADMLGMRRTTLVEKMRKYNLQR